MQYGRSPPAWLQVYADKTAKWSYRGACFEARENDWEVLLLGEKGLPAVAKTR